MYIDLEQINLILSIVLQLILIIGLGVLIISLINLIQDIQAFFKSINKAKDTIQNFVSMHSLPKDLLDYAKTSVKYESGKLLGNLIKRVKSSSDKLDKNSF